MPHQYHSKLYMKGLYIKSFVHISVRYWAIYTSLSLVGESVVNCGPTKSLVPCQRPEHLSDKYKHLVLHNTSPQIAAFNIHNCFYFTRIMDNNRVGNIKLDKYIAINM